MIPPEMEGVGGMVAGGEEREAANSFEAGAAEENIGRYGRLLDQLGAEGTDSRPGIEDQYVVAAGDLKASCIAAIMDGFAARAGDAAPHPPESNLKTVFFRQTTIPLSRWTDSPYRLRQAS